jgi:hypothetical protein
VHATKNWHTPSDKTMEANNNVQEQGAIPPNMPTNYTVEAAEILTLKYNVPFPDHADGMGSVQELKPLKPNVFVSAVGDKIRTNVDANTYAMYLIGKAIHSRRMGRDNTHPVQHLRTAVRRLNAMPAGTRQRANTRTGEDPHIYHILTVEVNRLKALYNRNGDSAAGREVRRCRSSSKGTTSLRATPTPTPASSRSPSARSIPRSSASCGITSRSAWGTPLPKGAPRLPTPMKRLLDTTSSSRPEPDLPADHGCSWQFPSSMKG